MPYTQIRLCEPSSDEAGELLHVAAGAGLQLGVSFHVGSQQRDPHAWDAPLAIVGRLGRMLAATGHQLSVVNLGGGLPSTHFQPTAPVEDYGTAIGTALERLSAVVDPVRVMVEPGRYLVGDAGVIRSEAVLVTTKGSDAGRRWVYLDIGMFSGLVETQEEAIRYRLRFPECTGPLVSAVLAGPTCDSLDVLYEREPYPVPADLADGHVVDLLSTGAYTTSYSSVWFNGFEPLQGYYLPVSPE